MRLKLSINPLDAKSVDAAIAWLADYETRVKSRINETAKRIIEAGETAAKEAFAGTDVIVTSENVGGGLWTIRADGGDVVFLEFGAGTATASGAPFAGRMPFEVSPGSWSEKEGTGEFANTGQWHYGGQVYTKVEPRLGMQKAYEAIKNAAQSAAKEAFGS